MNLMGIFGGNNIKVEAAKKAEEAATNATQAQIANAKADTLASRITLIFSLLGAAAAFVGGGYYLLDRTEARFNKSLDDRFATQAKSLDDKFAIQGKSLDDRFKAVDDRFKSQDDHLKKMDEKLDKVIATELENARSLGRVEGKLGLK